MNRKLITILISVTLVLSACGSGDEVQQETTTGDQETEGTGTTNITVGESIYQQSCASCHGGNLKGNMGPSLEKVGNKYTEEEILGIIENGRGGAMRKGIIQGEDAKAVASWLATMK